MPDFQTRFKKACGGRTQQECSDFLGIPQSTICSYMTGKLTPRLSRAVSLANALGVSVDWLVSGRGEREIKKLKRS